MIEVEATFASNLFEPALFLDAQSRIEQTLVRIDFYNSASS